MARIPMRGGFSIIPEGRYIFRIDSVDYDDDFGKMTIKMTTADGKSHIERFKLRGSDGELNDQALGAFSYFAKNAMNDFEMEDVDPTEMVGHYIEAEVIHSVVPSRDDPNKTMTFANLGDKSPASGFNVPAQATPPANSGLDLDALLNM